MGFDRRDTMCARYRLAPGEGEYLQVTLTSDGPNNGSMHVTGGFGSYGYEWRNTGQDDFRQFLVQTNPDYLYHKLTHRQQVYDAPATLAAVTALIAAKVRTPFDPNYAMEELTDQFSSLDDEFSFDSWVDNRAEFLGSWNETRDCKKFKYEPQCWAFCERFFPMLQERLREELLTGMPLTAVAQATTTLCGHVYRTANGVMHLCKEPDGHHTISQHFDGMITWP